MTARRRTLRIRGTVYPVLLPSLRDPRLHLASVIVSLQVLGQTAFDFRLSIAQILVSLLTCAVLEVAIAFRRQHVIMWPASALLTGNGVAFILRVPGTEHGDWWSLHGWWIFVATAALSLLSKYVLRVGGRHVFNPSNLGLVVCFLVLGSARAEPLDFWWGPMSVWLGLAIALIVGGGLMILRRLGLLGVAVGFWLTFAAGIALLAGVDHLMTARWHLGPIVGAELWRVLVFSPEILVFLFFMITDPKTVPEGPAARRAFGVSIGLLAVLLIAPQTTEFATKVAVLAALALVCAGRPLLQVLVTAGRTRALVERARRPVVAAGRGVVGSLSVAGTTAAVAVVLLVGWAARPGAGALGPAGAGGMGDLPEITIVPSEGVSTRLDDATAAQITSSALAELGIPAGEVEEASVTLEPGPGQGPPVAVATLSGISPIRFERTFELALVDGSFVVTAERGGSGDEGGGSGGSGGSADEGDVAADGPPIDFDPVGFVAPGLEDVADRVGLDFRHGSFRYTASAGDPVAMMGGGVCWLDYDGDGWLDLYVVNSYSELDVARWRRSGSLPRSALFHNDGGRFTDVSAGSGANLARRGSGCVAADFDLDGRTDLYVTSNTYDALLWNRGDGRFVEGARAAGIDDYGWHAGAVVGDVNGDGLPDLFVAGYTDMNAPITESFEGFPTNHRGVRDLLYVNQGEDGAGRTTFREVGEEAGIDPGDPQHGLGAVFTDLDGDHRLDLYVANDEDPNRLYRNVARPGGVDADPAGLGFRFRDVAPQEGVDDGNAGMGIAAGDYDLDGRTDLLVSNSRGQQHAVYRGRTDAFADVRDDFTTAFGTEHTGWGTSWLDLDLDTDLDLVLANGDIPVSDLVEDADPITVLENVTGGAGGAGGAGSPRFVDQGRSAAGDRDRLRVDGRGLAAADYDNDGDVDVAVSSIGGPLVLLENTAARGNWLGVALDGFHPGTRLTATLPDGRTLTREIHAGSSYLSSEDPRALFGLGPATTVRELSIRYPDGRRTRLTDVPANQLVTAD